jgi:hypothetical protein
MFHHDDGVGSPRDWGPGHDFDGFSRAHFSGIRFAGADLTDDAKATGNAGGAERKPVADRTGNGRIVAIGADFFGKNPSRGVGDRQTDWRLTFQRTRR